MIQSSVIKKRKTLQPPICSPWSYLNIFSCHDKQVSGLSCLAKGQSSNRIVALVQNLGLAVPVPGNISLVQSNTAISET